MKKLFVILPLAVFLLEPQPIHAQTIITPTTLSAAVTTSSTRTVVVASATCAACTGAVLAAGAEIYVDREAMVVTAVSATTLTVQRGASGTAAGTHASGALVFMGAPNAFAQNPRVSAPSNGSCTRANELYLPLINVSTALIYDCLGGQWVKSGVESGGVTQNRFRIESSPSGGTAYTSLNTNGTAVGATTLYCTEVWLPQNKNLTGIAVLNGTTVTGNARYVILYDSAGNALANSALAGAASVTASIYESFAFTAKFFAVGPAQYFACLQDNAVGSTTVRMVVTGTQDNLLTKGQTSAVFGTIAALVVPTTFTTAVGPYVYLY
ncbi:MAG: hypothetical protein V4502_03560 [Pseudomonadota bacterium]